MGPRYKQPVTKNRIRSIDGINAPSKKPEQIPSVEIKKRRKFKFRFIYAVPVIILLVTAGTGYWLINNNRSPIPQSLKQSAGFPIYYPDKLPSNYSVDQQSITFSSGIVTYVLKNGTQYITVNQQKEPEPPPDLNALTQTNTSIGAMGGSLQGQTSNQFDGFEKLATPLGQAVQGYGTKGTPHVIVSTNTTLINVTGSQNMSSDLLAQLVSSLKAE